MSLKNKWLPWVAICVFLAACQQLDTVEWDAEKQGILNIETRSADNEGVIYPLFLYAFSESGDCVCSQTIHSDKEKIRFTLPSGSYRIVAVAGCSDGYEIPVVSHWNDEIGLEDGVFPETPLMMGMADVEIDSDMEDTLEVILSYSVAALDISLADVPSEVSEVMVTVASFYSSLNFKGEYADPGCSLKMNCVLDSDNRWKTNTRFVFPGSGGETVFSITLKMKDGTKNTYGYVWKDSPKANRPYHLKGSYSGGFTVNGTFIISGWEEAEDVEFEFGAIDKPGDEEDEPELDLSDKPEIGSFLNGCLVIDVGKVDASGAEVLLMSLEEWAIVTSQVEELLSGYSVNGIGQWRLPSFEEAQLLKGLYSDDNRRMLNARIQEYDENLVGLDGEERYLCLKSGVYYSFVFAGGTNISKAGEKKTYYVRLVKSYKIAPK